MLAERAEKIERGLTDAAAARLSRDTTEAARSMVLKEAEHHATLVAARAEDEGKRERALIVKTAQDRAEEIVTSARLEAEESVRRAMKEGEAEMARTAILMAEKILQKS